MPRRTDLKRVLVIGSGPIVIGQACEFDYSGAQACKALREEGYKVILVNSNPATIMTDPEMADVTYIEPITWSVVEKIIEKERPDAILPTMTQYRDGDLREPRQWQRGLQERSAEAHVAQIGVAGDASAGRNTHACATAPALTPAMLHARVPEHGRVGGPQRSHSL